MRFEEGRGNSVFVHLTLLPFIATAGEIKTKPTQHSVMKMREIGIQPDLLVCRADRPITRETRDKIALFTNVDAGSVIPLEDKDTIYEVPLTLHEAGWTIGSATCSTSGAASRSSRRGSGSSARSRSRSSGSRSRWSASNVDLAESYKSLSEALVHGGIANGAAVDIDYVDAEEIAAVGAESQLRGYAGVLVPGGFGQRGSEGKVEAIRFARASGIPFLGICLGMQMAVVEYARNVAGVTGAASGEFSPDSEVKVIDLMPDQADVEDMGGTMRLGAYDCDLKPGTLAARGVRQEPHQRAPPPPATSSTTSTASSSSHRAWFCRGCPPMVDSSRMVELPPTSTGSSSAASSTPSSRAAPPTRTRCSPRTFAQRCSTSGTTLEAGGPPRSAPPSAPRVKIILRVLCRRSRWPES